MKTFSFLSLSHSCPLGSVVDEGRDRTRQTVYCDTFSFNEDTLDELRSSYVCDLRQTFAEVYGVLYEPS